MVANQRTVTAKTKLNIRISKTFNFRVFEYPSLMPNDSHHGSSVDVILQCGLIDPYPPRGARTPAAEFRYR